MGVGSLAWPGADSQGGGCSAPSSPLIPSSSLSKTYLLVACSIITWTSSEESWQHQRLSHGLVAQLLTGDHLSPEEWKGPWLLHLSPPGGEYVAVAPPLGVFRASHFPRQRDFLGGFCSSVLAFIFCRSEKLVLFISFLLI